MKRDDVFPSKYLKASDLSGKPITVKIGSAPLETLKTPDGKEQQKICLYLIGAKKVLPLNATNWDAVADIAGDDTDTWPGNSIELYPTKTAPQAAGQPAPAAPQAAGQPAPEPRVRPVQEPASDDMDDEIPF